MAWWEGVDEARLLIASDPGPTGDGVGQFLSLRHPKSGNTTCYLLINGLLHELQWFNQPFGSWFVGDYVCQDGRLYTATPVDPVFIMLPIFEEARMKKRDDPGKFRQLDEIMFITGYPGYQHLLSIAENSMQVVCDVKEIGSSKFFRLDDSKVLAWLYYKNGVNAVSTFSLHISTCQVRALLRHEIRVFSSLIPSFIGAVADAVSILGEYVKDQPWLKLLCNHLKLNLVEATREAAGVEYLLAPSGSLGKGSDKKSTKSGKQAKKAKVETQSKNIKEMFSRASRRRS